MRDANHQQSSGKDTKDATTPDANRDEDATSSETLSDLERNEAVSPEAANSSESSAQDQRDDSTVASPDGEFDASGAGDSRGNTDVESI